MVQETTLFVGDLQDGAMFGSDNVNDEKAGLKQKAGFRFGKRTKLPYPIR